MKITEVERSISKGNSQEALLAEADEFRERVLQGKVRASIIMTFSQDGFNFSAINIGTVDFGVGLLAFQTEALRAYTVEGKRK